MNNFKLNWIICVIIYISINFILLILFRNSEYFINRLLIFHLLIILGCFIKAIIFFLKNKNEMFKRGQNIKDSGARQGFYASAFNRSSAHFFFCYLGFFYIFVSLYIFYLIYQKKINTSFNNIILIIVICGFIIAIKETYIQFSQCVNSIQNGSIPYCDNHYYKYWNCIHNEYYTTEEQE